MLDLMQQELDFSRGEALTLASLTVDLIRRPAFTYRSSSVPGKPTTREQTVYFRWNFERLARILRGYLCAAPKQIVEVVRTNAWRERRGTECSPTRLS